MIAYGLLTPTEELVSGLFVFVVAPIAGAIIGYYLAKWGPQENGQDRG